MICFDPVEDSVEEVPGFLILHCQLFYFRICAGFFRDACLLCKALVELFYKIFVILKKLGHSHEGFYGSKCRFVLLSPFVEELFDVIVLIPLFNEVDKILAVAIKLGGGHCHFQSINNQLL